MPAYATLISTCPAAGCGTGRVTGSSTSGPPARAMVIAFMVLGNILVLLAHATLNACGGRRCDGRCSVGCHCNLAGRLIFTDVATKLRLTCRSYKTFLRVCAPV